MSARTSLLPEALVSHAVRVSFADGALVFREGARAQAAYFLTAGGVKLVRHGRAGESVVIHQAAAGEFFAEASLHSDHYHCSAVATQASDGYRLPAATMRQLLATDAAIAQQWMTALSRQLRQTRARIERLCLKSARERVRHLLLTESPGARGGYVVRGTLKDLAAELGLTHEALYRTLAAMERDRVLARDGNCLRLT